MTRKHPVHRDEHCLNRLPPQPFEAEYSWHRSRLCQGRAVLSLFSGKGKLRQPISILVWQTHNRMTRGTTVDSLDRITRITHHPNRHRGEAYALGRRLILRPSLRVSASRLPIVPVYTFSGGHSEIQVKDNGITRSWRRTWENACRILI